jgi:AraC family transcriptional regulator, glutamate-dependent acid resistance regulator
MINNMACLTNSISAVEEKILLRDYRIYKTMLLYSGGYVINLKDKTGNAIVVDDDSLVLLTKNNNYDVTVFKKRCDNSMDMKVLYISDDFLHFLYRITSNVKSNVVRGNARKEFVAKLNEGSKGIIYNLLSKKEITSFQYSYILSFFMNDEEIINSLVSTSLSTFVDRVIDVIESDLSKNWTIHDVSKRMFLSDSCLRKSLQRENLTFKKVTLDIKMKNASILLRTTRKNVYTIAESLGFNSVSYFIRVFREYYGMSPKKYIQYIRQS